MFHELRHRFFSETHPEWMDLPGIDPADLGRDLRNLEIINRHFGGAQATRFLLKEALRSPAKIHHVLDCGCGAGDLTSLLSSFLSDSHITAIDLHPQTLAYAEKKHGGKTIEWKQADMKKLPFPDGSFDLVVCQLALHHFSDADAVLVLRELKRVSKGRVFVTDLRRSAPGYWGVWLLVTSWLRDPMTRHDALLSVRRAFTGAELGSLAEQATWTHFHIRNLPWFRQALWMV